MGCKKTYYWSQAYLPLLYAIKAFAIDVIIETGPHKTPNLALEHFHCLFCLHLVLLLACTSQSDFTINTKALPYSYPVAVHGTRNSSFSTALQTKRNNQRQIPTKISPHCNFWRPQLYLISDLRFSVFLFLFYPILLSIGTVTIDIAHTPALILGSPHSCPFSVSPSSNSALLGSSHCGYDRLLFVLFHYLSFTVPTHALYVAVSMLLAALWLYPIVFLVS